MAAAVSLQSSVIAAPDTVFRELDGEAIVLELNSGVYFGLNAVGSRIWQLVQNSTTVSAICDQLEREFDVDRRVLEQDVVAVVARLLDKRLIELSR